MHACIHFFQRGTFFTYLSIRTTWSKRKVSDLHIRKDRGKRDIVPDAYYAWFVMPIACIVGDDILPDASCIVRDDILPDAYHAHTSWCPLCRSRLWSLLCPDLCTHFMPIPMYTLPDGHDTRDARIMHVNASEYQCVMSRTGAWTSHVIGGVVGNQFHVRMYVCMCVFVYVGMCVCVYVCMCVCVYVLFELNRMCVCLCLCVYVCMCLCVCVCMCVCFICVCTVGNQSHVRVSVRICVCVYVPLEINRMSPLVAYEWINHEHENTLVAYEWFMRCINVFRGKKTWKDLQIDWYGYIIWYVNISTTNHLYMCWYVGRHHLACIFVYIQSSVNAFTWVDYLGYW